MEERRPGAFKQFIIAAFQPNRYVEIMHISKKRIIGFMILFLFLFSFLGVPFEVTQYMVQTNGFKDIIDDNVPEFVLSDGVLSIEESYVYNKNGIYLYIGNDVSEITADQVNAFYEENGYESIIILVTHNGAIRTSDGKIQMFNYESLKGTTITKDTIKSYMKYIYIVLIILSIFCLAVAVVWYLFKSSLYAIAGSIMQGAMKLPYKLDFGKLFAMGAFAKIFMYLVRSVSRGIGVSIPYTRFISIFITLIYMFLALDAIKKDQLRYVAMENGRPWNGQNGYNPNMPQNNMNQWNNQTMNSQYTNQNVWNNGNVVGPNTNTNHQQWKNYNESNQGNTPVSPSNETQKRDMIQLSNSEESNLSESSVEIKTSQEADSVLQSTEENTTEVNTTGTEKINDDAKDGKEEDYRSEWWSL